MHRAQAAEILSLAFAMPVEGALEWLALLGPERLHYVDDQGLLGVFETGHWWGGRPVAGGGVAGVAIAPQHRGRGLASRLLAQMLRSERQRGVSLSTLYPATEPVYRKAGYERAGVRYQFDLPLASLPTPRAQASLEVAGPASLAPLYDRWASQRDGYLVRGPQMWSRLLEPHRGPRPRAYLIVEDQPTGYFLVSQTALSEGYHDLTLHDYAVHTDAARDALVAFLGNHRSLGRNLRWWGGLPDPLVDALPEQSCAISIRHTWMLRLVDPVAAFAARPFPVQARLETELQLSDPVLAENAGPYRLRIEDGVARLEPGGSGQHPLSIGQLAALYSGYLAPRRLGLGEALWASTLPAMAESF